MKFPKFLRVASLFRHRLNTANETAPFVIKPIDIVSNKLIDLLAKKLRFSYEVVFPIDGEFGRPLPDGNWTGMVGMIHRGDADIIIDNLSVTESRSKVIDFSQPYFIDKYTFATKFTKQSHNETAFLKPFTFEVWLAILIGFSVSSLISNVLFRKNDSKKRIRILNSCSQSSKKCKEKSGVIFLKSGSIIAEAFLRFFYTSVLLSFLVIPSSSDIRTISDLAKAINERSYRCVTTSIYHLPYMMAKSEDPNLKILARCITEYKGLRTIDALSQQSENNMAYIALESYLKYFRKNYFVSADGVLHDLISIGMKKDFCCKKQLDSTLSNIMASGTLNKFIENDYFHKVIRPILNMHSENPYRQLSLKEFKGLFVLVFIGYFMSMITLFFEILVHKLHKNRNSMIC